MRSPGLNSFTSAPTATTSPAHSRPSGAPMTPCPNDAFAAERSARLSPHAFTRVRTLFGFGTGFAISLSTSPSGDDTPAFIESSGFVLLIDARGLTRLLLLH